MGSFNTHQVDFNAQIIEPKTGLTFKPSVGYNFSKNNYTMKGVRVLNPEKNEFETGDFKRFHDDYRSVFAQFETGFTNKLWADFLYVTASFTNVDKDIQTGATQDVVYGAAHRKIAHGILVYAIVRKTSLRKDSHYRLMLHIRGRNLRPWIRQW